MRRGLLQPRHVLPVRGRLEFAGGRRAGGVPRRGLLRPRVARAGVPRLAFLYTYPWFIGLAVAGGVYMILMPRRPAEDAEPAFAVAEEAEIAEELG